VVRVSASTRFRRRSDWILLASDAAVGVVSVLVAAWVAGPGWDGNGDANWTFGGSALVFWVSAARACGLYERAVLRPGWSGSGPAARAAGAVVAAETVLALLNRSRGAFGWALVLGTVLFVFGLGSRTVLRHGRRAAVPFGVGLERYAVLDNGEPARRLTGDLTRAPGSPFEIGPSISGALGADEAARQVLARRLDGVIVPAGYDATVVADLSWQLAPHGVDVLVEPGTAGRLDVLLSGIAVLHGVPLLRARPLLPRRKAVRKGERDRGRHGVAVLGTRGVPANYGGFETFAERLALHLVDTGISPTVYCRTAYATEGSSWRGVRLVTLPTIRSKYLDTVVHTALSVLHLCLTRGPRDVVLCNAANAPVLLLLKAFRRRVVLNVDGLEWRRSKWGVAGRSWYRMGEWLSVRLADVLVTDAHEVRTYYKVRHDTDSVMIPYGADLLGRGSVPLPPETPDVRPDGFVLYVSRWESENNPLMVARAHAAAGSGLPLVMLGKATYDDGLDAAVRAAAAPDAFLPGPVFGDGYKGLQANARCYVHATEVGGTHPALIEAMGAGNLVLCLDTPENREVAGAAAKFFRDEDELARLIGWAARMPADELAGWREKSRAYAASTYTWSTVGDAYVRLLGAEPVRAEARASELAG
jgi:glycosyltransferase involved in cell wall biosynthesis